MLPSVKRNTDGPGLKPPIESVARIKSTAAALPGIPSDSTGIKLAPETDEFAASVMPSITSANTNAPTLMIGQKGVAMMRHNSRYQFE